MGKGRENKAHIGIFGRRNNGKSSLINLLAGQDVAIVSDIPGTTTDPVKKSVEIHGIGPVVFIDTAGIDDDSKLGSERVMRTKKILMQVDLAILVITRNQFGNYEKDLVTQFDDLEIPFIIIHNKSDEQELETDLESKLSLLAPVLDFSSVIISTGQIDDLVNLIKKYIPSSVWKRKTMLGDLLSYGDIVLLITPIDMEAPEGRIILPQVQAIRDILDNDCTAIILKEREVDAFLKKIAIKPKLVITDSQVFLKADASIPKDVPLTSFSIMLARHKGDFFNYIKGTPKISELENSDRILLLESCTHHVSCDDIGRVKIPRWISNFTGKKLNFETVSGLDNLPRSIDEYALVIQCGGCMITHKQLMNRISQAVKKDIPITNYGMAIAYVQGIFNRAVAPFIKLEDKEDYL